MNAKGNNDKIKNYSFLICVHLRFNKNLNSVPSATSVVKYRTEMNRTCTEFFYLRYN